MAKIKLGPQSLLYPMPALLVGAQVKGQPNFITVAWGGIACGDPPMISVAIRHTRHSLKGILENKCFSVNVPGADLVREVDYCGIVSGAKTDKVAACNFNVITGKLCGAPLIEQCPINLECELYHTIALGSHVLVIGRITETHISEDCLTNGRPDVEKINPLIYTTAQSQYQTLGEVVGKAFSIGNELKD